MRLLLLTLLLCFCLLPAGAKTIDITSVGGKGDGKYLNTRDIHNAIERLEAAGGGTLYFPAGTYLTGPITLQSNITIDISAGAVILFSDDFSHYLPFVEMRYEGVVMKSFKPLFYAYEKENITIKGQGKIDGNGRKWWYATFTIEGAHTDEAFSQEIAGYQERWTQANPGFSVEENSDWRRTLNKRFFRPPLMQPFRCKNFRVEGITIVNSPFWTINPEFCENVTITGVTINNPDAPNTDGVNPSSCRNVIISDCHISVGDDCITLKSGRDRQGREIGMPCENIAITNCVMLAGHGGVVIGSEMSGDVRKVTISNCVFDGTDRGIRIKSTRGRGGVVEDIRVSNIVMNNIQKEAIVMNLFYTDMPAEPVSERTPVFRNIHIAGVTGSNVYQACKIAGIEESPVSDISFRDINIDAQVGFFIDNAASVSLSDVCINVDSFSPFAIMNSSQIRIDNISSSSALPIYPLIAIENSADVFLTGCFPGDNVATFVTLGGGLTDHVIFSGNYFGRLAKPVIKNNDLKNDITILIQ